MPKLLLATRNEGKLREIRALLAGRGIEVLSLEQVGPVPEVEETGETFEENALLKAGSAHRATGLPALADDSGLIVDALGGEPGVCSARYGGPGLTDEERVIHLLQRLGQAGVSSSPARFRCAMALVDAGGTAHVRTADWEGTVEGPPEGGHGFGYDPVFRLSEQGCTSAQLPPEEKNHLSHRGQALRAIVALLAEHPELLGPDKS